MVWLVLCGMCVAISMLLGGCATPITKLSHTEQGTPYVLHVGEEASTICELGYACTKAGNIYVPHYYPAHVLRHEEGHIDGMEHAQWNLVAGKMCALVIRSGGRYHVGQVICMTEKSEEIL